MRYPLFLTVVVIIGSSSPAWALRCGNAIVREHDTIDDIREQCGEPTKSYQQNVIYHYDNGSNEQERYQDLTVWFYRFGDNEFAHILIFQNNRLLNIIKRNYGSTYDTNRDNCKGPAINAATGLWTVELELLCGSPNAEKRIGQDRNSNSDSDNTSGITSELKAWRYDFPDTGKTTIVNIKNGIVTSYSWKNTEDLHW